MKLLVYIITIIIIRRRYIDLNDFLMHIIFFIFLENMIFVINKNNNKILIKYIKYKINLNTIFYELKQ